MWTRLKEIVLQGRRWDDIPWQERLVWWLVVWMLAGIVGATVGLVLFR